MAILSKTFKDYHCSIRDDSLKHTWFKVNGRRVTIPGIDAHLFMHRNIVLICGKISLGTSWQISEATSGRRHVGWAGGTIKETLNNTIEWASSHQKDIGRLNQLVQYAIAKDSESPGYPGKAN